jgi:hypothetical protein
MLLDITYHEGNFFVEEWTAVVDCMSQLDKVQQEEIPVEKGKLLASMRDELSSQHLTLGVDRIFSRSDRLNQTSIVAFGITF